MAKPESSPLWPVWTSTVTKASVFTFVTYLSQHRVAKCQSLPLWPILASMEWQSTNLYLCDLSQPAHHTKASIFTFVTYLGQHWVEKRQSVPLWPILASTEWKSISLYLCDLSWPARSGKASICTFVTYLGQHWVAIKASVFSFVTYLGQHAVVKYQSLPLWPILASTEWQSTSRSSWRVISWHTTCFKMANTTTVTPWFTSIKALFPPSGTGTNTPGSGVFCATMPR